MLSWVFWLKHRGRQALSPIMQRAGKLLMRQDDCERLKRIKTIFEMTHVGTQWNRVPIGRATQRAIRCLMTPALGGLFIPVLRGPILCSAESL